MGDHLNEWLLDYPQHLKDQVIKLNFAANMGGLLTQTSPV